MLCIMVTKLFTIIRVFILLVSFGRLFGGLILKMHKTLTAKGVQVVKRRLFILQEPQIIILIQVRVRRFSPCAIVQLLYAIP